MESSPKKNLPLWLAALFAITFLSWSISKVSSLETKTIGAILITLAFLKARLIIIYFMELPSKPVFLKIIFEGWIFSVWLISTALYLGLLL